MAGEPPGRQARDLLQRARLLEQVRRAGHDLEPRPRRACRASASRFMRDHRHVVAAHDQERRGAALAGSAVPGQVGPAAARDHRADASGRSAAATSAAPPPVLAPK